MADAGKPKPLFYLLVVAVVFSLVAFALYRSKLGSSDAQNNAPTIAGSRDAGERAALDQASELVETKTAVPRLAAPGTYRMKDNTLEIELSEYAGYAGLIVANHGLAPSDESVFFKRHGFKLKISISEAEDWSAFNSGAVAASATTADVLAVYGRQLNALVPLQLGFSRGADGVVVRSEIRSINQLKGKTLVASQFNEADFFIRFLAQEAGIEVNPLPDVHAPADAQKVNLLYGSDAFAAADLFSRELKGGSQVLAGCVTWAPKTSEVADGSGGKARVLITNRNILIVADVLIVNKGFAQENPKIVAGLVEGILQGNQQVRDNPEAHLELIARSFSTTESKWDRSKARTELAKVHLSNFPENLAFFSGAIDAGGSFSGIYQSAVLAYGSALIPNPSPPESFLELSALQALEKSGAFSEQKVAIAPVRASAKAPLETDPLLSKNIRFLFMPNTHELDLQNSRNNAENLKHLEQIKRLLQLSPGSRVLLRGHVDNARVPEFRAQGGDSLVRQMALSAMQLSQNRAQEVKRVLLERVGIDGARVDTLGRGWEEPLGTDAEQNRRVEIQWFTVE